MALASPNPDPEETKQPRALYLGDGPWEGDEDFKTWQRRRRSITRWDLMANGFPVAGFVGGATIWSTTGNVVLANVALWVGVVLGIVMGIRKWWWSHTGS